MRAEDGTGHCATQRGIAMQGFAVAPTIGATVGGDLTNLLSWHWPFLINVVPSILVTVAAMRGVALMLVMVPLIRKPVPRAAPTGGGGH